MIINGGFGLCGTQPGLQAARSGRVNSAKKEKGTREVSDCIKTHDKTPQ